MYAGSMIGGKRVHGLVLSNTVAVYNYTSAQKSQSPDYNPSQRVRLSNFSILSPPIFFLSTSGYFLQLDRYNSLLGVAGTDVPVSYLRRYIRPHDLGPNGYAFLMTKNGYVTIHPKLKLFYDGELRKTYRSMSLIQEMFLRKSLVLL